MVFGSNADLLTFKHFFRVHKEFYYRFSESQTSMKRHLVFILSIYYLFMSLPNNALDNLKKQRKKCHRMMTSSSKDLNVFREYPKICQGYQYHYKQLNLSRCLGNNYTNNSTNNKYNITTVTTTLQLLPSTSMQTPKT